MTIPAAPRRCIEHDVSEAYKRELLDHQYTNTRLCAARFLLFHSRCVNDGDDANAKNTHTHHTVMGTIVGRVHGWRICVSVGCDTFLKNAQPRRSYKRTGPINTAAAAADHADVTTFCTKMGHAARQLNALDVCAPAHVCGTAILRDCVVLCAWSAQCTSEQNAYISL